LRVALGIVFAVATVWALLSHAGVGVQRGIYVSAGLIGMLFVAHDEQHKRRR
jgi:multisubunit Na+/H+ antiporter MnhB subunit